MVMEFILTLMERDTKAIGGKISKMVLEKKLGLMGLVIKVIIDKEENQDKENLNGLMVRNMKGTFSKIIFMERVLSVC